MFQTNPTLLHAAYRCSTSRSTCPRCCCCLRCGRR
jgi:hypothetical protein